MFLKLVYLISLHRNANQLSTITTQLPAIKVLNPNMLATESIVVRMLAFTLTLLIPQLVLCFNEGNIHLLEDEISDALRSCSLNRPNRQRRSSEYSHIDGKQATNVYYHERRDQGNRIHVLNGTDYDYMGYGGGDVGEKYIKTKPQPALKYNNNSKDILYRNKRQFLTKDSDQVCF